MTDAINDILSGGAFTRQQATALRQLLVAMDRYAGKGTTAERPGLLPSEAGAMYFDTTLAADGQPIWWTGDDWVDAAGVVV